MNWLIDLYVWVVAHLDILRTWIATLSGVGATLTVAVLVLSRFWHSFLGKMVFFNTASLAAMFDLIAFARWTHRGRDDLIFAVVYGIVMISIWGNLIAFWRVKRRGGLI